ncbi:asparaginase [Haloferax namakaokahaiae]|uniref:L-asparaginase n=1 Tax=Haloferax namakaokahaiae TaxID=1748331 RepID=A0ABD5ZB15_9EURY
MPHIRVVSCGGTIASEPSSAGAAPEKTATDLVERVPTLESYATLSAVDVASVPGFDADFESIFAARDAIEDAFDAGVDGVVVTHGTDTLADVAFALELCCDPEGPVVVTGAQRRFDEPGSDAPSNLLTAVRAATDSKFDGTVTVAFDDELHRARDVVKTHTNALDTFQSPGKGPVATFTRETVRSHREATSDLPQLDLSLPVEVRVPVVHSGVAVDGTLFDRALADADGIVVEGTGLGNVTGALGERLAEVAEDVPIVVSSRCHAGPTEPVYGTPGGAVTLDRAGVLFAGDLPTSKARLLLTFCLAAGGDPASVFE